MTVQIRRIGEGDHADWERLFKAYIEFYRSNVPDAVIALTWRRLLAGPLDGFLGLVAERDNQVVGIAHVLFHPSTWSPTCYCYLEDLFVDPSARGGGIGRRLIEAVYEAADAKGATRTYWTTQEFNYRARTLYDTVATRTPFIRYQRHF
jgi:GNAT superfamily N-acetyltransferase